MSLRNVGIYLQAHRGHNQRTNIDIFTTATTPYNLLVEEDNVRLPNFVRGKPQDTDSAVVSFVPLQLIVIPHL
jgi:hypothetical protein